MPNWRATAAASLVMTLLSVPSPAQAQDVTVTDEVGDASTSRGLDITGVQFANHDHAIVTTLQFIRDRRGKVLVAVKTRDQRLAAFVVSRHRRRGPDSTFLFGHVPCRGLASDWDRSAATLKLRLPARCVLDGTYGAIASWVLIEGLHSGADVDYAPEKPNGEISFTDWIPRG